jgi:hypothetical protein
MKKVSKEKPICAAVRLPSGRVIKGDTHESCLHEAIRIYRATRDAIRLSEVGYVMPSGRFVKAK